MIDPTKGNTRTSNLAYSFWKGLRKAYTHMNDFCYAKRRGERPRGWARDYKGHVEAQGRDHKPCPQKTNWRERGRNNDADIKRTKIKRKLDARESLKGKRTLQFISKNGIIQLIEDGLPYI